MKAGIKITEGVDAERRSEAARYQPQNTVRATVDWPLPPDDGDETILPSVVAAISQALAACGSVAFRSHETIAGAKLYDPPPPRTIISRLLDIAGLGKNLFGIVIASDPAVIAALFDYGWSYALQAALVFDPEADPSPIFQALRLGLDWRGRPLPDGARLLFGPGHDGDFAVIAGSDAIWLERFKSVLD